jgi:hypothetical protein
MSSPVEVSSRISASSAFTGIPNFSLTQGCCNEAGSNPWHRSVFAQNPTQREQNPHALS